MDLDLLTRGDPHEDRASRARTLVDRVAASFRRLEKDPVALARGALARAAQLLAGAHSA